MGSTFLILCKFDVVCVSDENHISHYLLGLACAYLSHFIFQFLCTVIHRQLGNFRNSSINYDTWRPGILQNSALVAQNSADHFGENHEILRISAEFRRMFFVPQNCSAELENVIIFCRSLRNWAKLFCGILRVCLVPQNSSAGLCIINPFGGILQMGSMMFRRILWNFAD